MDNSYADRRPPCDRGLLQLSDWMASRAIQTAPVLPPAPSPTFRVVQGGRVSRLSALRGPYRAGDDGC
jgi:hypothetical protein